MLMVVPVPPQETQVNPMTTTMDASRTRGALGLEQAIASRIATRQNRLIQSRGVFPGGPTGQDGSTLHTMGAVVLTEIVMDVLVELEISTEPGHEPKVASSG